MKKKRANRLNARCERKWFTPLLSDIIDRFCSFINPDITNV